MFSHKYGRTCSTHGWRQCHCVSYSTTHRLTTSAYQGPSVAGYEAMSNGKLLTVLAIVTYCYIVTYCHIRLPTVTYGYLLLPVVTLYYLPLHFVTYCYTWLPNVSYGYLLLPTVTLLPIVAYLPTTWRRVPERLNLHQPFSRNSRAIFV